MKDETQIVILDARKTPVRIALIAAILFALLFGWFAARWQFGNMLAELTTPNDPNAGEIAELAARLAPADPLANWLAASTKRKTFSPDIITETARNFESVVRLSPFDYRWWVELGRALEQAEEYEAAEKAYLRSLQLAPTYIYPRWQLGNFYLRRNRTDEAFEQLKVAATADSVYRDQVFSIAWEFYENDTARLESIAGNSPRVRAGLARFYAIKQLPADALRIWNTLSNDEKAENENFARLLAQAFYDKRFYRQSQAFVRDLKIEPESREGTIQNGGFEESIGVAGENYFGWRVFTVDKVDVKLDPTQKREGNRSLRVSFAAYSQPTLNAVTQVVTVEPQAKYQLTFWVKTENLKSGGTPVVEIYNANDDKNIVTSEPFPTGTTEWQQVKLEFAAPPNAEAVIVRTARFYCGDQCPIIGTIWYDDFKMERIK